MGSKIVDIPPEFVEASMSAVLLAAGFVVQSDEAWHLFEKFMEDEVKSPLEPGSRVALDGAIEMTDAVRHSLCDHHGIPHGLLYTRKYPS
jgi:hypothetical protein